MASGEPEDLPEVRRHRVEAHRCLDAASLDGSLLEARESAILQQVSQL
jgi:hypothetical protein